MKPRVIKSVEEYQVALAEAARLVELDPEVGTPEADQLELLAVLIGDYEERHFHFNAPDPVSAIQFRMEEQGLRQKDLVQLLGSRSRVSEILAGKRPLTVPMVRALSQGLGIPADILVSGKKASDQFLTSFALEESVDWTKFPVQEMERRGWFESPTKRPKNKRSLQELVKDFFDQIAPDPGLALYRRRFRGEGIDQESRYSILAWTARVLFRAKQANESSSVFDPTNVNSDVLKELAHLSAFESGPRLAVEFLEKLGIRVIIEPKLSRILLDGAALLGENRAPVIGLTLRHDRVDAFWFTLLHEVAHVWKHLSYADQAFVDCIEQSDGDDYLEKEANRLARETFIPRAVWRRSSAFLSPSRENIQSLADELRIHPAIVVGRLHYETGNYSTFNEFLRQGAVRRQFPEVAFR